MALLQHYTSVTLHHTHTCMLLQNILITNFHDLSSNAHINVYYRKKQLTDCIVAKHLATLAKLDTKRSKIECTWFPAARELSDHVFKCANNLTIKEIFIYLYYKNNDIHPSVPFCFSSWLLVGH